MKKSLIVAAIILGLSHYFTAPAQAQNASCSPQATCEVTNSADPLGNSYNCMKPNSGLLWSCCDDGFSIVNRSCINSSRICADNLDCRVLPPGYDGSQQTISGSNVCIGMTGSQTGVATACCPAGSHVSSDETRCIRCGDGFCDSDENENSFNCQQDCSLPQPPTNPGNNPAIGEIDSTLTQETLNNINPLLTFGNAAETGDLTTPGGFLTRVLTFAFPIAGLLLLVMLVWGGFEVLSGATYKKNLDAGKNRITAAIIGFLLLFASYWIIQIIGLIFGASIF